MRIARLLSVVLAVLSAALVLAPAAAAEPPFRVPDYVTDRSGVLSPDQLAQVESAVDNLYNERRVRLWVVYVDNFNQDPVGWARVTMQISSFGDYDALLAVATDERSYAFLVPSTVASQSEATALQRNEIEPQLRQRDWAGAAVAAADGLLTPSAATPGAAVSWVGVVVALLVVALIVLALVVWSRRRRRKRREAEFAAAKRVDPSDPQALASVPIDALDDLSKMMVVDVDNAVRTSDGELSLAVEEFGAEQTEPFSRAVTNARTTLAQAFNVRQILDDAVPETTAQRRDLLTRVVVAAAKADRELEAQSEAFDKLRDLVINAPSRLDAMTQQMVDLTARLDPSEQALAALHNQFDAAALTSVAGNVQTARERLGFADRNISTARNLVARPVGQQMGLVDAIRAAESSLGQARSLLDAIDSAGVDINRAVAALPEAIADIQNGVNQANGLLQQGKTTYQSELSAARDQAAAAIADAQKNGGSDPLGAFTRLTKADAELDRLLATVLEEQEAAKRLSRAFDQALFSAQSRVRGVSDFIDTRRGSIGPEARTRLAEAVRQLQAAQDKRPTNISEAIAHANGADMLAGQAQTLASNDVAAAQRHYTSGWGGGGSGSDMGGVIGGIIIGNILSGALRGGFGGGFGGGLGMGRSTSFGGSSRSSGRSYSGGGGRF
ncbi:TPM domain-containing protein [Mycobacterium sp. NPDC051804]|uniref:TPM domain-containing protein n=1 Tax=Mycobacterium sp. NPDC051804 TaxID=3364295 RepID=UPI0037AC2AC1